MVLAELVDFLKQSRKYDPGSSLFEHDISAETQNKINVFTSQNPFWSGVHESSQSHHSHSFILMIKMQPVEVRLSPFF